MNLPDTVRGHRAAPTFGCSGNQGGGQGNGGGNGGPPPAPTTAPVQVGWVLFTHDEQGRLIGEYDEQGNPLRRYIWLNDLPVALIDDDGVHYIHTDHLNTPQAVTDDNGTLVWAADYAPFGEVTETIATLELNLRFPGQYLDRETGLHQNWHREYDPMTGRYTQSDPIGLDASLHTYVYVSSNPAMGIDPQGLVEWSGQLRFGTLGKRVKFLRWRIPLVLLSDYKLELESACIDNQQARVLFNITEVDSNFWNLTPIFVGSVTMSDSMPTPMPGALTGPFSLSFGSLFLGGGDITSGVASGKFFGGGATVGNHEFTGRSNIAWQESVDCCND